MKITELYEDGSSYIGSTNIASAPSQLGSVRRRETSLNRSADLEWHQTVKNDNSPANRQRAELRGRQQASLKSAKARIAKQRSFLGRLKSFLEMKQRGMFRISESFDINDVLSRLSSLEADGQTESTVSFGIEDDEGNLMKVTVRSEQAEEFEERLAAELADAAQRKEVTGEKSAISMAELLLKLNDEFDIVDASFPTIPTDGVYNADKVQYGIPDTAQDDIGGLDAFPEGDPMGGDPMAAGAEGGDPMGGDPMGGDPMGGDPMAAGAEGGDPMGGDPMAAGAEGDEFFDDESVEDFPEDIAADNPEQGLLTAVLKMLTADAEAKKAQADAEAEKARAQQAEYTALAAKNSIAQQEEVMRMEAEMEKQKAQEKEAKKLADLARYRVSKASSFTEGTKPSFAQFLVMEFEEFDTVQSLTRQRGQLRLKYAIQHGDDPETIKYKREALMSANKELDAKIRHAQAAARYKQAQERAGKKAQPTQQPMRPGQQPNQQAPVPGQQGTPNAI